MTEYLFAGETERERLQLQAQVWEPEVEAMLDRIGVRPGWACLDLGCGALGILGPLSRRVGPEGRVVGVDRDAELLSAARDYVEENGLANVELVHGDVLHHGLPRGSFDLVHERFLLPHVPAPPLVLREMVALARPGGVIAVQEPDNTSWNFFPPSPNWPRLKQIIIAAFAGRGDSDIGQRTFGLLHREQLVDIRIRAAILAVQDCHPYIRMALRTIGAMRHHIVASGISTDEELDQLLDEIEQHAGDPAIVQFTFTVAQVWGRKPIGATQ